MTKHKEEKPAADVEQTETLQSPEAEQKAAPTVDPVAVLESQVKEWKDKYTYLAADYDTYRRRTARDIQTARAEGMTHAVEPMITVFDHFRMAMNASDKSDNIEKVREGLVLIYNEFQKAIKEIGIEAIEAEGAIFDPNLHEAISNVPSDKPEGTVIQQWNCGYRYNGRLIRPARVVVSAGKSE